MCALRRQELAKEKAKVYAEFADGIGMLGGYAYPYGFARVGRWGVSGLRMCCLLYVSVLSILHLPLERMALFQEKTLETRSWTYRDRGTWTNLVYNN